MGQRSTGPGILAETFVEPCTPLVLATRACVPFLPDYNTYYLGADPNTGFIVPTDVCLTPAFFKGLIRSETVTPEQIQKLHNLPFFFLSSKMKEKKRAPLLVVERDDYLRKHGIRERVGSRLGVYMWVHKKTGATYVGCSLYLRELICSRNLKNTGVSTKFKELLCKDGLSAFVCVLLEVYGFGFFPTNRVKKRVYKKAYNDQCLFIGVRKEYYLDFVSDRLLQNAVRGAFYTAVMTDKAKQAMSERMRGSKHPNFKNKKKRTLETNVRLPIARQKFLADKQKRWGAKHPCAKACVLQHLITGQVVGPFETLKAASLFTGHRNKKTFSGALKNGSLVHFKGMPKVWRILPPTKELLQVRVPAEKFVRSSGGVLKGPGAKGF